MNRTSFELTSTPKRYKPPAMSAMKGAAKAMGGMFTKKAKKKGPHPDHKDKLTLEINLGPNRIRLPLTGSGGRSREWRSGAQRRQRKAPI